MKNTVKQGFTLVELAIVIVIIGLLIGGVLAGRELIEQARIRSAIKEYQSLSAAFVLFKDRYNGLPGDISNGSAVFPNCSTYTANCNGDNNQLYDDDWVVGDPPRVWVHLVLSEILPNKIKPNVNNYYLSNSFPIATWWAQAGIDNQFAPSNGGAVPTYVPNKNYVFFTGHITGTSRDMAIATPTSAYNIDNKIDDGLPQTGKVMAGRGVLNNSQDCLGTGNTYLLTLDAVTCMMLFDIPN